MSKAINIVELTKVCARDLIDSTIKYEEMMNNKKIVGYIGVRELLESDVIDAAVSMVTVANELIGIAVSPEAKKGVLKECREALMKAKIDINEVDTK